MCGERSPAYPAKTRIGKAFRLGQAGDEALRLTVRELKTNWLGPPKRLAASTPRTCVVRQTRRHVHIADHLAQVNHGWIVAECLALSACVSQEPIRTLSHERTPISSDSKCLVPFSCRARSGVATQFTLSASRTASPIGAADSVRRLRIELRGRIAAPHPTNPNIADSPKPNLYRFACVAFW
jgi:hypothetical protein